MTLSFFGTGLAQVHVEARDGYMNHVGLDLTFLSPEAGTSTRGQTQGPEWRGDFLAELFSFDLDLERYSAKGGPGEHGRYSLFGETDGSAESPLFLESQTEDSRATRVSVSFPEVSQENPQSSAQTPALFPTEEGLRVDRQPTDSENREGRSSEAGATVLPGRSIVRPAGQPISLSLGGFNAAVAGWGKGNAIAWNLGSNPAEVLGNRPASETEGLIGVASERIKANEGSGRHQIANSPGSSEIADSARRQSVTESRQVEVVENSRNLVSQLNSSAVAKNTQILQERLWLPNGGVNLAEGATGQWMERAGKGDKTATGGPSVPAPRTTTEVAGNSERSDVTRHSQEAVTTGRPSSSASGPSSAAASPNGGQESTARLPISAARERPDTAASRPSPMAGSDGEEHGETRRPVEAGASRLEAGRGSVNSSENNSFGRPVHKSSDVWRALSRLALPPNLGPALRGFLGREGYPSTRDGFGEVTVPAKGQGKVSRDSTQPGTETSRVPAGPDVQTKGNSVQPEAPVNQSSARRLSDSPWLPAFRQGDFVQLKNSIDLPHARLFADNTTLPATRQAQSLQPEASASQSSGRPPADSTTLPPTRQAQSSQPEASVSQSSGRPPADSTTLPATRQAQSPQPEASVSQSSGRSPADSTALSSNRQGQSLQPDAPVSQSSGRSSTESTLLSLDRTGLRSSTEAIFSERVVQNPERATKLPPQFEAQRTPEAKLGGEEQVEGEERAPDGRSKRVPGSGSEAKSGLESEGTSQSRPRSFSNEAPKGVNPLERSFRPQTVSSPRQTPLAESVGSARSNETGVDQERAVGSTTRSAGPTEASSGPPRTVEPSVSLEGSGRHATVRPLVGTVESSRRAEQGARSVPESSPESRTRDVAWKISRQGSKEDLPDEANPVRMGRDSRSQSRDPRGEKVSLTSSPGRVPGESSVGKSSVNWAKEMGGSTVDAAVERIRLTIFTREGQVVARSARAQPEPAQASALEGHILKAGLGPRPTLPASQSHPVTLQAGRGVREIPQGRAQVQVQASPVPEQSDPVVDQNAKSAAEPWVRTPITLGKDLRGESRERQQQSPRENGSLEQVTRLGQATRPVSSNLWPDQSIRGGEGLPPKPEEPVEPEADTRQPKKAFLDSELEDSNRPLRTEDKSVDPKDPSSERVWKAGEKGLFQAGTVDRTVELSLPPKGTSLEAGNASQGQDVSNSSSRSYDGSGLSRQSIPVWLQSPTAFVDAVANQFVQHSRFLRNGETVRFDIELNPEFLGKIRIKTSVNHQNQLTVEIRVDDPDVREALERRTPALVEKLQGMGVEPDRLKVDGFSSHSQSDTQQQEGQRRDQTGAGKTWSQLGADEVEEEWPEWPETIEGEGIHYFA